jgi:glutamate--cysteine ligase
MINWLQIIKDNQLNNLLFQGRFGLERENIRVDTNGKMATTPHPNGFADKSNHPFITTDFGECQVELITPICKSTLEARQFIETLQDIVHQELHNEYLWPYSQPPILPDDEHLIQVAQNKYFTYLTKKYGKHELLLSGVHFNFSFKPKFLKTLYQLSDSRQSWTDFKNEVYFKIARFFIKHSWLMSYLFGFGDLIHQSYRHQRNLNHYENFGNDAAINKAGFGFRTGQNGFKNQNKFNVSFDNLEQHLLDLNQAISVGHLLKVREFYSPLRVKGKNKSYSQKTLSSGIEYLEIRNIDLNPFEESGVSQDTLDFIHLFLIYGLLSENTSLSHEDYALSNQNSLICAQQGRLPETKLFMNTKQTINIHQWANQLLNNMKQLFAGLNIKPQQLSCLNQPQVPLSLFIEQIENQGYMTFFLNRAQENHKQSLSRAYQLKHYEDLELSSQILLREAIKKGVEFDFLE